MPTGFRDLKLVPDDVRVASESRSESESDPDILETFPENLRMNKHFTRICHGCEGGIEKSILWITIWHHNAC